MKLRNTVLLAALGLMSAILVSVQTVQSAPIPISSVPFVITAPGTYVLTRDLTAPPFVLQAILIATNIQGAVVLDLKGFKVDGGNNAIGISIGSGTAPNTYPITIKNGIVSNGLTNNPGGVVFPATDITLSKLTLLSLGITFNQVSFSTVENCIFQEVGMQDLDSPGGNRFINLKFINNRTGYLTVAPTNQVDNVVTLEHCEFAPPAK